MFLWALYTYHDNLNFACTFEANNIQTSPDQWTALKYHKMTDAVTTCTFFTLFIFTSLHCITDNVLVSHTLETSDMQVTSQPLRKDFYINSFKIFQTFTKLDMTNKNMTWKTWQVFSDRGLALRGLKNCAKVRSKTDDQGVYCISTHLGLWIKHIKWK